MISRCQKGNQHRVTMLDCLGRGSRLNQNPIVTTTPRRVVPSFERRRIDAPHARCSRKALVSHRFQETCNTGKRSPWSLVERAFRFLREGFASRRRLLAEVTNGVVPTNEWEDSVASSSVPLWTAQLRSQLRSLELSTSQYFAPSCSHQKSLYPGMLEY